MIWYSSNFHSKTIYGTDTIEFSRHVKTTCETYEIIKLADLCIKISEGEETVRGIKKVFKEIMAENFWKLKKETDIKVQETMRASNKWTQTGLHQHIL